MGPIACRLYHSTRFPTIVLDNALNVSLNANLFFLRLGSAVTLDF